MPVPFLELAAVDDGVEYLLRVFPWPSAFVLSAFVGSFSLARSP